MSKKIFDIQVRAGHEFPIWNTLVKSIADFPTVKVYFKGKTRKALITIDTSQLDEFRKKFETELHNDLDMEELEFKAHGGF